MLALIVVGIPLALLAIHTHYMPLDELLGGLLEARLGLEAYMVPAAAAGRREERWNAFRLPSRRPRNSAAR